MSVGKDTTSLPKSASEKVGRDPESETLSPILVPDIFSRGRDVGDRFVGEHIRLPDDIDAELMGAFIAEGIDMIISAEESLISLETAPGDMAAMDTIFRALHTIKGTSAFFEISVIADVAHHAESLWSRIRGGRIALSDECAHLAMRAVDMIRTLFHSLERALTGEPFPKPQGYDDMLRLLKDMAASGQRPEASGERARGQRRTASGQRRAASGQRQAASGQRQETSGEPLAARPSPLAHQAEAESLMDVARGLRGERYPDQARHPSESSVRVPVDRLDRFIDMVGELVVSHSMVAQHDLITGTHHDLSKKVSQTGKIVRDLQTMSMAMRMVSLKATFRKMANLVRDMAHKLRKNVTFVTNGEETEIDRNMVDVIHDPLIHIIRNALDHGIESPTLRQRTGKPPQGVIRLSASHAAGHVVMEIADDGKGVDRKAILAKAEERGMDMMGERRAASGEGRAMGEPLAAGRELADHELFDLIFQPGFSTVRTLSEVSGRGMGLHMAKKGVDLLHGQIELRSVPKKGSLFKINLPRTLAIIDGMVVRVGEERYVMPMISIVRSVRPSAEAITTVLNRREMLSIQGRLVPLFRMAEFFDIKGAETDPERAIVVIIENSDHQAGILVDELIGSQQIVVKSLGETLRDIPGISGSAIMPDGRVGLILDVAGLVDLAVRG